MTDRKGHNYEELLQIQSDQLAVWGKKIYASQFLPIMCYVQAHNRKADADGIHQVFRGQDLIEIIRQWPDLQPPYPSPTPTLDDV